MVGGLLDIEGRQQTATDPALLDANRNRLTLCVELYEKSLINEGSASVVSPHGSSFDNYSLFAHNAQSCILVKPKYFRYMIY